MGRKIPFFGIAVLGLTLLVLLGCRTFDLVAGRPVPPSGAARPTAARAAEATPTPNPDTEPEFVPASQARCEAGDNAASVVTGKITQDGAPLPGMRVQASSGPGGEPISDEPAESDENGDYQVTFVCDGKGCNGAFWVWLIDEDLNRISPFVQFIFDNNCRVGSVDFQQR